MKTMQQDFISQIELRDREIAQLQAEKLSVEDEVKRLVALETAKYEDRLALVKKIHEDQLQECKRSI